MLKILLKSDNLPKPALFAMVQNCTKISWVWFILGLFPGICAEEGGFGLFWGYYLNFGRKTAPTGFDCIYWKRGRVWFILGLLSEIFAKKPPLRVVMVRFWGLGVLLGQDVAGVYGEDLGVFEPLAVEGSEVGGGDEGLEAIVDRLQ